MNNQVKKSALVIVLLIIINTLSYKLFKRIDITEDKRYTLSEISKECTTKIDKQLLIDVYLEGEFPAEFERLQTETKQFLEEITSTNKLISFRFIDPKHQEKQLIKQGIYPSRLTVEEDGKVTDAIIFPWAKIYYGKKTKLVSLLPNTIAKTQEEQLQNAISSLEFTFIDAINTLQQKNRKKIAVLTGNGELEDKYLYSFLSNIKNKYSLAKFTLDSVETSPINTTNNLQKFDLAIIAKPTERFTENEKLTLDQFITNGGKSLWMIDNNVSDTDSLYNEGTMLAYPRDLNLTDLLFSYGVRVNNKLIKDLNSAKIPLATGNIGNQTQFQNLHWFYHPLARTNQNHPITKNVLPVRLRFATQLDTLKNDIRKTPLLISSLLTNKVGTPRIIELKSISKEPKHQEYNKGLQLFGVLLEGKFNSAYKDRTHPFKYDNYKEQSSDNKMVIISDADICKNQFLKGKPQDLSIDKWTKERFGNNDFLINTIDYLINNSEVLQLRNKTVIIRNLDKQKSYKERNKWQWINITIPLLLLVIFRLIIKYWRIKKYT